MGHPSDHAPDTPAFEPDALLRPGAYPVEPREVEHLETHCSWLFFAGERVYKVKKPVDLGFLDFTTLARRKHFCEEEVRLNRRLAPDVYLGVVPIVRGGDGLRVKGEGEALEWAVEMRRLPAQRILAAMLDRGELDNALLDELVDVLVRFHREAATGPGVDEHGAPSAVLRNALDNLDALERTLEGPHRIATAPQLAYLREGRESLHASAGELLRTRVEEHRIRDGHGDLHAGNVCFTDGGVVAYDCIEFSTAIRCGDVASDLAFLTMDLDARGFPGFARYLARRYEELAPDPGLPLLLDAYKGYRAAVRAKVGAIAAADGARPDSERRQQRLEAMRYLHLAVGYELPPAVILMCGLPACGKSWLAGALARALRARHLESDVRRRHVPSGGATDEVGFGVGRYSPENRMRVYRSLLEDVVDAQVGEHPVIVDASFSRAEYRRPFLDAAARMESPWLVVHVTASEDVTFARLARRERDPHATSEADREVYLGARAVFEPPAEVPREHLVEVRGDGEVEDAAAAVLDALIALDRE